ncbi:hypothetical protein BDA99DRAFT_512665 [Phascolomyces articulosus]|uniref:Uncharacterized protein n=1 Tax=Phascolomyces articulosus TaxID=60185 RepID=A0AAD5PDE1_9FUNG|nr:hypothetical protein BDA99DRAFT_512665 [Phascolomyces articulosus]
MSRLFILRTILRQNYLNNITKTPSTAVHCQYRLLNTSTVLTINKQKRRRSMSNTFDAMQPGTKKQAAEHIYGVAKNGVEMQILLSDKEARICNLLEKVSDYIGQARPDLPRIESRIAGGWVRDKVKYIYITNMG